MQVTDFVHLYRVNGRRKAEQVRFQVTLLDEPGFTSLATGAPKSASALQLEICGDCEDAGYHPVPSP